MEEWTPISREDFEALLAEQVASLEESDRALWEKYGVALQTAPIFRSKAYGMEQVFVVAVLGDQALFFDDAEDEFGVARLPGDGPLTDYGTYGDLCFALRGLAGRARH